MEGGGMAGDQLSGLDTAFLCLESADAPMHLGALAVFDGRAAVPLGRLVRLPGRRAVEIGLGLLDGYTDLVAARTMPEAVDRSVLGTVRSAVRFAAHPDRLLGRVARTAAGLPGAMREVGGIAASVLSNVRLRTDR